MVDGNRGSERQRRSPGGTPAQGGPPPAANPLLGEVNAQKLIQELQLHKIELEMQNDELQRIQEDLRASWKQIDRLVVERAWELSRSLEGLSSEPPFWSQAQQALNRTQGEAERLCDRLTAENAWLRQEVEQGEGYGEVTGRSAALSALLAGIAAMAPLDTPLLLLGEPGTGKGAVARAIHGRSDLRLQPIVTLDCTALPLELLEAELFGNAKRTGRWELAGRGILFLDEIAELPEALQARLLRTLQAQPAEGISGRTEARVVAATSRNLEEACAAGRFRADLLEHLLRFHLRIPPLRERREDIPALVETFVVRFNRRLGKAVQRVSDRCMARLMEHTWPGNVRELESVVEQAMIVASGPVLELPRRF